MHKRHWRISDVFDFRHQEQDFEFLMKNANPAAGETVGGRRRSLSVPPAWKTEFQVSAPIVVVLGKTSDNDDRGRM
jgi:hypothetical protein